MSSYTTSTTNHFSLLTLPYPAKSLSREGSLDGREITLVEERINTSPSDQATQSVVNAEYFKTLCVNDDRRRDFHSSSNFMDSREYSKNRFVNRDENRSSSSSDESVHIEDSKKRKAPDDEDLGPSTSTKKAKYKEDPK